MELRRQETLVRQLTRQVTQLEKDKHGLTRNVTDAENALRTTSRDRDTLTKYLRNVEDVLESVSTTYYSILSW